MSMFPPSQPGAVPQPEKATILGHPPGLFLLFLVEMWERFSYYGMRGLLVLYLISVIGVHQLPKGVYTNEIQVAEMALAEGQTNPAVQARQSIFMEVVVGGSDAGTAAATTSAPPASPAPGLKLVRLKKVADPADATKFTWEPDPEAPAGPVVVSGPVGGTADRGTRGFQNTEVRYRVTNPGDRPIKAEIEVLRRPSDPRTFFTINDGVGALSTEIKPDKDLTDGNKPYDIVIAPNLHDSGRNWTSPSASVLYGWYTGLAYLFPILGGLIADKLIGTHRSMVIGGLLIAAGHTILGISGFGEMAQSPGGMSLFMMGLAVIVLGTGHFKPCVSVMVGQLYAEGDPRRDGAFTIFYMGINLGAFICAFVCGTLGEKVGWHWGFGSAAVGMLLGLGLYMIGRPMFLKGIGEAPPDRPAGAISAFFLLISLLAAAGFAAAFHAGALVQVQAAMDTLRNNTWLGLGVVFLLAMGIFGWAAWFVAGNRPEDRGPVVSIFLFMFFNAFFWIAFEQAGSSLNVFTEQNTDRMIGTFEVPATWFQSVNAGLIFILAPIFAAIWTGLGKRRMNPSQPMKIAMGLLFLALGYVFMVFAGQIAVGGAAKAGMIFVLATYFWHTVGELCLSPTGLSYVTKAAPVRFVSLLMGIWFVSSFIANLGGGLVASLVERIEQGKIKLWWHFGGQADFFFLFVLVPGIVGVLVAVFTPQLKKLMRHQND